MKDPKYGYFLPSETMCKCGCKWDIQDSWRTKLNEIREAYGKPISASNYARCKAHNVAVGGAKRSAHIDGVAADLVYDKELAAFIEANLERFNIWMEHPSVTYPNRIHIDGRLRVGGRKFFP